MADIWGFAGGMIAGREAQDQHMLSQQLYQENQALFPYKVAESKTKADMDAIALKQAEISLANQQRMMDYLKAHLQTAVGGTMQGNQDPAAAARTAAETNASMLENFAGAAAAGMNTEAAGKLYTQASEIRKNQSEIEKTQQTVRDQQNDYFIGLLNDVHDQKSWENANMLAMMQTGQPTPFMGPDGKMIPYSPAIVKQIRDALVSQKDRAQIIKDQAEASNANADVKLRDAQRGLIPTRRALMEAQALHLQKETGLSVKAQDKADFINQVKTKYDLTDQGDLGNAQGLSLYYVERMLQIQGDHPGMARSEAAKRAFQEADAAGTYMGFMERKAMPGGSWVNPMPLPRKAADLQKGEVYTTAKGPGRWNGTDFDTQGDIEKKGRDARARNDQP